MSIAYVRMLNTFLTLLRLRVIYIGHIFFYSSNIMQLHGRPAVVVMVIINQKYYISKLMKEKISF